MTTAPVFQCNVSNLSPSALFVYPSTAQPIFARNFGGETTEAQLTGNMALTSAAAAGNSGSLIGTPTISADYMTAAPNNAAGITAPITITGAFTMIVCVQCPTWSTTNFGQLIGNSQNPPISGATINWELGATGLGNYQVFSYTSNANNALLGNGSILPTAWKLLGVVCTPGTSTTVYDFTNNTNAVNSITAALPAQTAPLQIGTFATAGSSTNASVNFAETVIWNYALTGSPSSLGSELANVLASMRTRLANKNGITTA